MITLVALAEACSSSSFTSGACPVASPSAAPSEPEDEDQEEENEPEAPVTQTKTFPIVQVGTDAPADIIWLIDNSGSMADEAATVRDNMGKFVTNISTVSDAHTYVVSAATAAPVTISVQPSDFISQIDTYIGSFNGLAVLASLICPAATSIDGAQPSICGVPVAAPTTIERFWGEMLSGSGSNVPRTLPLAPPYMAARYTSQFGALNAKLRPSAKTIIIAVTDDEALIVQDEQFKRMVETVIPKERMRMFAIATKQSSLGVCNIANIGFSYEKLATGSGGAMYDICEKDWSKLFDVLIKDIRSYIVPHEFKLPETVKEIVSVKIDGKALDKSMYKLNGNVLDIDANELSDTNKELTIEYL